jgi:hypothetical protein
MPRRFLVAFALALLCLPAVTSTSRADHRSDPHDRIWQRAGSLAEHSRELYDEIRVHYRASPFCAGAMMQALSVRRSAQRLAAYGAAHSRYTTLEREMQRLEASFHALEETLRTIAHHGTGHRHVRELMRCMDDLVHDIHDDIHDLRDRHFFSDHDHGQLGRGGHLWPDHRQDRDGGTGLGPDAWYFGGGGFSLRLGR